MVMTNGENSNTYNINWTRDFSEDVWGPVKEFAFKGEEETFTINSTNTYKIEVWGAQAANARNESYPGGKGGYSSGNRYLTSGTRLYVNVGGQPYTATSMNANYTGGYNGGGSAYHWVNNNSYCSAGGGATHVALSSGLLKDFISFEVLVN